MARAHGLEGDPRYFHLPNETEQRHMGRLRLLGEAGGAVAAGGSKPAAPGPEGKQAGKEEP